MIEDASSATGTATTPEEASFTLVVEFIGLAVFARHADDMIVLQPDAHLDNNRDGGRGMKHLDSTDAVPHVGYLSFDLQHLGLPAGTGEGVIRFARDEVTFRGLPDASTDVLIDVPDFDVFAPVLQLDPGLLGAQPSDKLLTRVPLRGGTLRGSSDDLDRIMTRKLPSGSIPGDEQQSPAFANTVEWKCKGVRGATCVVEIKSFQTESVRRLELTPVNGKVAMKIANLCGSNPLEWNELYDSQNPPAHPPEDFDFKWLSILFKTKVGEQQPVFSPGTHADQVPFVFRTEQTYRTGLISNCIPGKATFQ